jgi:hypothetical protein
VNKRTNIPLARSTGGGLASVGLVISPYAKRGYVDHQTLSFDAHLKFVEGFRVVWGRDMVAQREP